MNLLWFKLSNWCRRVWYVLAEGVITMVMQLKTNGIKEDTKMKKNYFAFITLAFVFAACTNKIDVPGVYTMTVNAVKGEVGDLNTRALALDETTSPHQLNATWVAGEVVEVYQSGAKIGELTAAASASTSTTLSGSFASVPSSSADLTFYFHSNADPAYAGQDGTLATIASTYDFCAPATVTVGNFTVDDVNKEIDVPGGIIFGANQQAIVKFTLKQSDGSALPSNPTSLTIYSTGIISLESIPAATFAANGNCVLFVALPGISSRPVKLVATVGSDKYIYEKSGVTFANGSYNEIPVKMRLLPDGAIAGMFSVEASVRVYFSKGNLNYVDATSTWKFADAQKDYLGESQTGGRDMFAYNGYTAPVSWWRLSRAQWIYLSETRTVTNTLSDGARYTMATVGSVKGLIIFPDIYTHPEGTGFVSGTFNNCSDYTASVDDAGWTKMEAAGCVFLPATGYKSNGETWKEVGNSVYVSSSSANGSYDYYTPRFSPSTIDMADWSNNSTWTAVRLVHTAE